ncbi:MAG: hypothetical protein PHN38_04055 [Sulfurospirillaceae bacterium]|nr:hypothetical protein [Sulfurospirillaceae bacterium]MDD3463606.1 hypothetical protein [Sulfurospirillaceae bacterium]
MKWLNELKVAIIEKDTNSIGLLVKSMPQINDLNHAIEAQALISQAIQIIDKEKTKAMEMMKKIKQTKAFVQNP